ncbi:MAG: membrane protein insertion efficiency factor YidD [Kiritimatiellae bacterium]|jgi:putative membrane protein insertion efficiency factor|nr:membrane protein insertion efficiency factor YidD [Kiritimatiellia bacterium]MDD2346751.1 membrane protein insertion efficiency factor YidD [Kiritimatiellia bacterium]MDD3583021.1 membrane protein insertion efficiency factor YidD [Kiritimatiellia bacterium]HON48832.1 membrane protein insertion efficiency factor YidD [Kiritimatiellia bacterium]HRT29519.1 membrane protein insertion efficiency factor YidD [Kiritimatiellia bacterium]
MGRIVSAVSRAVSGMLILLVRAYQVVLSPHLGRCCRFEPTCSAYCIEALRTHGVFKGCLLTLRRVMRCRPFGPSGYDPVPPKKP